jgi:hypothetical protein
MLASKRLYVKGKLFLIELRLGIIELARESGGYLIILHREGLSLTGHGDLRHPGI